MIRALPRRPPLRPHRLLSTLGLLVVLALGPSGHAPAAVTSVENPRPTVVLVHGAFADASSWNGVTHRLQARGYSVVAPANPLRSLQGDAAYLASILAIIQGPVVLVGHSYGGMVMTNAAVGAPNVKALVYVAALGPDVGDTMGGLVLMNPGSQVGTDTLVLRPYPVGVDAYIAPGAFHEVFCADLPDATAAFMAASQRPLDAGTLVEPSGPPAWRTIPSWFVVARQDRVIPPATERFMARRMGATTVEVDSSHVPMISNPDAVTTLILEAAGTVK